MTHEEVDALWDRLDAVVSDAAKRNGCPESKVFIHEYEKMLMMIFVKRLPDKQKEMFKSMIEQYENF